MGEARAGNAVLFGKKIFQEVRKMQIFEELKARGLLAQLTDEEEIRELVNNGKATFYMALTPLRTAFMSVISWRCV